MAKKPKIVLSQKEQLIKIVSEHFNGQKSDKDISHLIWVNPRGKNIGGMRLTHEGYKIFTENLDIKTHNIILPSDCIITNQVIIWLDRFIDGPYYIEKNSIIVFKERTAIQLILFGGDIQKYGKSKALIAARARLKKEELDKI